MSPDTATPRPLDQTPNLVADKLTECAGMPDAIALCMMTALATEFQNSLSAAKQQLVEANAKHKEYRKEMQANVGKHYERAESERTAREQAEQARRTDNDWSARENVQLGATLASAEERIRVLEEALSKIADFTTGYDDVAGIVCKIAQAALAQSEGKDVG